MEKEEIKKAYDIAISKGIFNEDNGYVTLSNSFYDAREKAFEMLYLKFVEVVTIKEGKEFIRAVNIMAVSMLSESIQEQDLINIALMIERIQPINELFQAS